MKAYIDSERNDWPIRRMIGALEQYAPDGVEIIGERDEADLVLLHVTGRRDQTMRRSRWLLEHGHQYAVIQYSLRSTQRVHTSDWLPLWREAVLTWSYYDLDAWCSEEWTPLDFPFYHAPLGVDSRVFYPRPQPKRYIIATSGRAAVTESIREAAFATKRVEGTMFHLGPDLKRGSDIVCDQGMDDEALANILSQCHFVAGLRRTEGFELMAAEGLMCGARPICFDRGHYRQWHSPWAVFIPEGPRGEVVDSLEALFRQGPEPVREEERQAAAERFDWKKIVEGFWRGCLH